MKKSNEQIQSLALKALGFSAGQIAAILGTASEPQAKAVVKKSKEVKASTKGGDFDSLCHAAAKDRPTISGIGGTRIVNATNAPTMLSRKAVVEGARNGDENLMAELWYRATKKGTTPTSIAGGGKVKEKIKEAAAKPTALRKALTGKKHEVTITDDIGSEPVIRKISPRLKKNALAAASIFLAEGNRAEAINELKVAGLVTDGRKLKGDKLGKFIEGAASPKVKPIVPGKRIPNLTV